LTAGERIELPVRFIVDPGLPKDIGSLSLGYTLFDLTKLKEEAGLASL
jgi:Cytochrome oxidase assembly factor